MSMRQGHLLQEDILAQNIQPRRPPGGFLKNFDSERGLGRHAQCHDIALRPAPYYLPPILQCNASDIACPRHGQYGMARG
ncbi:hypothetical protein G6L28_15205 [Agrobacterium larrymoorei]|uniref:hypothetical protein n=1 Tax=Agrobacterium larrymoorei TaxID=160699 RepID=UPI001573DAB2|nr:hypothetical protein [Agrobacterium larrymoorei]NTJ43947.1 hypothetical protein [Agrobacterium larrymoorei]